MNLLVAMRYLVALDKHRHFGRAAQACHITQPALSNALRSLENSFGVPIVKRSRTYGGLTAEGEVVLESARRQLREMELLEQDLHSANDAPRGALRLAAVPTAVPLLALFAAMLQRQHAGLRPVVLAMGSPGIEAGLQDLSIDLALGYVERKPHRNRHLAIASLPLFEEQYYFLRRATTRAAGRLRVGAEMRWSEAATQPLCLLTPDMHFRSIVDGALSQGGAPPEPAIETNSLWALGLSVAAGEVATILPGAMIAAFRTHGDLEALPLVAPDLRTPVGILSRAKERPSRAVQAALTLLRHPEWETLLARYVGERS
jgi:DNA-binding transcriptional LysR family regulator